MVRPGIIGLTLSLLALPLQPPSPHAPSPPADTPTGTVAVRTVSVAGSGCPKGSVRVAMGAGNAWFRIWFTDFRAAVGGDARSWDARRNCQLTLGIEAPDGYTYAISRIDHTGFMDLARGVAAIERTNHYFQGRPAAAYEARTLTGPALGDWYLTSEYGSDTVDWAPCGEGRLLNLDFELRMVVDPDVPDALARVSSVTKDSMDIIGGDPYTLAWRRC